MLFKPGSSKDPNRLQREWNDEIHPDLRTRLIELERFTVSRGIRPPLITQLVRYEDEQVAIYFVFWSKLLASQEPGPHQGMVDLEGDGTWRKLYPTEVAELSRLNHEIAAAIAGEEKTQAKTLGPGERAALVTEYLKARARNKSTWHSFKCAGDLRTTGGGGHWSRQDLAAVDEFLRPRCAKPQWEYLIHDVTAPHLHLARRDFGWKARGIAQRKAQT